ESSLPRERRIGPTLALLLSKVPCPGSTSRPTLICVSSALSPRRPPSRGISRQSTGSSAAMSLPVSRVADLGLPARSFSCELAVPLPTSGVSVLRIGADQLCASAKRSSLREERSAVSPHRGASRVPTDPRERASPLGTTDTL